MSNFWIETYTHKKFDYLEYIEEDICIEDIAHALSNLSRFTGHTMKFYSVAQHSILVSDLMVLANIENEDKEETNLIGLYGLLHDASEAYLCDLSTPLKQMFPKYKTQEKVLQTAIYSKYLRKYDFKWTNFTELLHAKDVGLALIEANILLNKQLLWPLSYENSKLNPDEVMYTQCWLVDPLSPKEAEQAFINRFIELQE